MPSACYHVHDDLFNVIFSLCVLVCKFKAHKRCAVRSTNNCKWTTLASIGNDIIEDEDGVSESFLSICIWSQWYSVAKLVCLCGQVSMPHQWLEGNLPVSAKCEVCDRNCGSVRRLQDWRCLWCKAIVRHLPAHSVKPKSPVSPSPTVLHHTHFTLTITTRNTK